MKIIINKDLRKLRSYLNENNIHYLDFMLNHKILKIAENDRVKIINKISRYYDNKITEKEFNYYIDVFNNDKDLFNDLMILLDRNIPINDEVISIYYEDKELFSKLVYMNVNLMMNDVLNHDFIEKWSSDLIKKNYEIINQINYDNIKDYIPLLNEKPELLKKIYKLFTKNDKKIIEKVINLENDNNISEIAQNVSQLKDDYFISYYLDNYNNEDIKNLVSIIINNYHGKLLVPNSENDLNLIYDLIKISGISLHTAQDIYYYKQLNKNIDKNDIDINYQLLLIPIVLNSPDLDKLTRAYKYLIELKEKGYEISHSSQLLLDIFSLVYDKKITNGMMLQKASDTFKNKSSNFDINQVIFDIQKYKRDELTDKIVNPENMPVSYYLPYEQHDGTNVEIPVIKVDDPNFRAIVHTISIKNSMATGPNYELTQKLLDNPELWMTTKNGNPNLSLSYLYKAINIFGNGLLLGFSEIEPERLLSTYANDGATPMNIERTSSDLQFVNQEILESLKQSKGLSGYNEILLKRYYQDKTIEPNYLIIITNSPIYKIDINIVKKWAYHFNIPIVEIDARKMALGHKKAYYDKLEIVENSKAIDFQTFKEIDEERFLISNFIPSEAPTIFSLFASLVQSIDLDNIDNINSLIQIINYLEKTYSSNVENDWMYKENKDKKDIIMNNYQKYINTIKDKYAELNRDNLNNDVQRVA